jgi:hypothetical protein
MLERRVESKALAYVNLSRLLLPETMYVACLTNSRELFPICLPSVAMPS